MINANGRPDTSTMSVQSNYLSVRNTTTTTASTTTSITTTTKNNNDNNEQKTNQDHADYSWERSKYWEESLEILRDLLSLRLQWTTIS